MGLERIGETEAPGTENEGGDQLKTMSENVVVNERPGMTESKKLIFPLSRCRLLLFLFIPSSPSFSRSLLRSATQPTRLPPINSSSTSCVRQLANAKNGCGPSVCVSDPWPLLFSLGVQLRVTWDSNFDLTPCGPEKLRRSRMLMPKTLVMFSRCHRSSILEGFASEITFKFNGFLLECSSPKSQNSAIYHRFLLLTSFPRDET